MSESARLEKSGRSNDTMTFFRFRKHDVLNICSAIPTLRLRR